MEEKELIDRLKAGDLEARQDLWNRYSEPTYQMICRVVRVRTFQDPRTLEWTRDLSDAHDILSKTFLKAFLSIARFRAECPLQNWLFVIASNTARSFYRDEARHHPKPVVSDNGGRANAGLERDENEQPRWIPNNGGDPLLDESNEENQDEMIDMEVKNGDGKSTRQKRRRIELSTFAVDAVSAWGSQDDNECRAEIERLMVELSEEHRLVLTLRGFNGMTVKETAAIMGITDEAVRSLKHRAVAHLTKLWDPVLVSDKGGQSND